MIKRPLMLAVAAAIFAAAPASAVLQEGARVPSLVTQGALAGKPFSLNLQQELRKGPVVLYFFPRAFTPGCNLEAQAFAAAIDDFKAAGAQVFGLSGDNLQSLTEFSEKECAGAFAVARATPTIIDGFDVAMTMNGEKSDNLTSRTSYVIAPDGRVVMVHSDLDWSEHVGKTLAAVRALKAD